MKKITDMMINKLVVDPSLQHENNITDMIHQLKIDIISYKDNEEILMNLYYTMKTYLSEAVVDDIVKSSLTDDEIKSIDREYKLESVLKK